jgi:hypothetical protein
MKCVIVGHTTGLGLAIYNYFRSKGWEVVGLSRSNGYDATINANGIVSECIGADLVVLSSYADGRQAHLVNLLKDQVKNIAVCGSIARLDPFIDFIDTQYVEDKAHLAEVCRLISISPQPYANVLHIDISFLEGPVKFDPKDPTDFCPDYTIEFSEVTDTIDFWLAHPKIRQVEFRWKLTPFLSMCLNRINKESTLLANIANKL